jgi:hypothetical protein
VSAEDQPFEGTDSGVGPPRETASQIRDRLQRDSEGVPRGLVGANVADYLRLVASLADILLAPEELAACKIQALEPHGIRIQVHLPMSSPYPFELPIYDPYPPTDAIRLYQDLRDWLDDHDYRSMVRAKCPLRDHNDRVTIGYDILTDPDDDQRTSETPYLLCEGTGQKIRPFRW